MSDPSVIQRLVGVYDADGTIRGEIGYWIGARLGRTHCALCDITHSSVRERADWKRCRAGFPVPFDVYHRNDQPPEVRSTPGAGPPCVVAETAHGFTVLLDGAALEGCDGSPDALADAIDRALVDAGLTWPDDRMA